MFLEFERIENVRDLGGLTRLDGKRVREGRLYRTGHLHHATDHDIQRLEQLGVACVIDFRDYGEVRRSPDKDIPGAKHLHLPALPALRTLFPPVETATPKQARDAFYNMYRYLGLSPESMEAYTAFFQELLALEGKPVIFHCTQGKDRTGVAAMLLMSALGFDREAVIAEYMRTNQFMQGILDGMVRARVSEDEMAVAREVFWVFEENVRYYFHCIEVEYSSIETYLEMVLNLGPEEIEKLQEYYLE